MKSIYLLMGTTLSALLVGCSSTPVVLAPVGPNPIGSESKVFTGGLRVFSSVVEESDDQNQGGDGSPTWHQHTDYKVYTLNGKLVRRVDNTTGHYAEGPRRVVLPPGQYLVKAQAKDYFWVELPVVIERGRTTSVHLDDEWKVPSDAPKKKLVSLPNGNLVGWHADSMKQLGSN